MGVNLKRADVEAKYKWDLSSIVKDDNAWEKLYAEVDAQKDDSLIFKGKLGYDDMLLKCLQHTDKKAINVVNLYCYAAMKRDEDGKISLYQGMKDRIENLSTEISSIESFILPEIVERSREQLLALSKNPQFSDYSYLFVELARKKDIYLSEKEEKLISEVGLFSDNFQTAFAMFDNVDVDFGAIKDENGNKLTISHGSYSACMQSYDRRVRRDAFEAMFNAYKKNIHTISAIYAGNVKKDYFYAKIRGFKSCLDYELYSSNIDNKVYDNLIEAMIKASPYLHRLISLRKSVLGLDKLTNYDLYVPLVGGVDKKYSYDESFKIVKDALKPFGEEYVALLQRAYDEKWIDVYETSGKRSGAYSWGTYTSHPYVLLNHNGTTHDVFTIAHELGHSMHSYYSNLTQPYAKASYDIFVAEVASTVNEVLLLKYLMAKSSGDEKKYLVNYYLEMFRTTIFRQTMFAEFELAAHKMVENNEPLTADALYDVYYKLNEKYYGKDLTNDELIGYEWARIPHFYTSFYVYKYSTGLTAAVYIAENILKGNKKVLDGYREFLKAGGSMPPCDILKMAGVDLNKSEPFDYAMNVFKETIDELEKLCK